MRKILVRLLAKIAGFLQIAALSTAVLMASAGVSAQAVPVAPSAPVASKPLWTELTPAQQQALKPLEQNWGGISEGQKRKWLEISKNYASMAAPDRETLHSRMNEWVDLSPQQRSAARLNFGKTQELARELTAEEKKAKWEQYQALSPEEKQKLASTGTTRQSGAAAAIKPVEPQKLAPVAPVQRLPSGQPKNPP